MTTNDELNALLKDLGDASPFRAADLARELDNVAYAVRSQIESIEESATAQKRIARALEERRSDLSNSLSEQAEMISSSIANALDRLSARVVEHQTSQFTSVVREQTEALARSFSATHQLAESLREQAEMISSSFGNALERLSEQMLERQNSQFADMVRKQTEAISDSLSATLQQVVTRQAEFEQLIGNLAEEQERLKGLMAPPRE